MTSNQQQNPKVPSDQPSDQKVPQQARGTYNGQLDAPFLEKYPQFGAKPSRLKLSIQAS